MAVSDEQLRQSLEKDLSQAKQRQAKSEQAIGSAGDSGFGFRAARIKGKAVAQSEISEMERMFKKASDQLVEEAGFADQEKEAMFRSALKQRFNSMRMQLISRTGELRKQMKKERVSKEKERRIRQAWLNVLGQGGQAAGFGLGASNSGEQQAPQGEGPTAPGSDTGLGSLPPSEGA